MCMCALLFPLKALFFYSAASSASHFVTVCVCVCVYSAKHVKLSLNFSSNVQKKTHQTTQEALFSARWIIRCKSLGRLGTVQQKCFGQVTPSDTDDTDNHKAATQLKRARLFITKRGINFKGI